MDQEDERAKNGSGSVSQTGGGQADERTTPVEADGTRTERGGASDPESSLRGTAGPGVSDAASSTGQGAGDDDPKVRAKKKGKLSKKRVAIIVIVVLVLMAAFSGGSSGDEDSGNSSTTEPTEASEPSQTKETEKQAKKRVVDKSALNQAINQASAVASGDYTPESYAALSNALAHAQELSTDDDATQSDVDSATSSLNSAFGSLVEQFKAENYSTPAFSDVARNPDSYKGQKIAFTGKVLQVVEGSSEIDLRIATDGAYDDVVFVGYDPDLLGGTRVLEDDSVTVYGTCVGQYTYQSTLGGMISLPALYADQVVIN